MLGWPKSAKHLVCGLMEVFRKGLEVSIREARWVRLDGCEIVVIGGRLGEDLGET